MDILEILNMPPCQKTRVPIKTLEVQLNVTPIQKKLLETHVSSINLISLLNEQTVRIRPYKDENYSFMAIYVFEIELKKNDQLTELSVLIHSAFPESTLLIYKYSNDLYLSGAIKRINKSDKNKSVIEDIVWARLPNGNDFNISNIIPHDLKQLYESIVKSIYSLKVESITGIYPKGNQDYKIVISKYETLSTEINQLKEEYNKVSMIAEKLEIDNQLYDKEEQLKRLITSLKGEN